MWQLLKTKSFWGGVGIIAGGVGLIVEGEINLGVAAIIGGLQAIFIRDAIRKVSAK